MKKFFFLLMCALFLILLVGCAGVAPEDDVRFHPVSGYSTSCRRLVTPKEATKEDFSREYGIGLSFLPAEKQNVALYDLRADSALQEDLLYAKGGQDHPVFLWL